MQQTFYDVDGRRVNRHIFTMRSLSHQRQLDEIFLTSSQKTKCKSDLLISDITSTRVINVDIEKVEQELESLADHRRSTKIQIKKQKSAVKKKSVIVKEEVQKDKELIVDANVEVQVLKDSELSPKHETRKLPIGLKITVEDFSTDDIDNEVIRKSSSIKEPQISSKKSSNAVFTDEYSQKYSIKIFTPVSKFVRAIKTINLLLNATRTNVEQSKKHEKKYLTFTDIQDEVEAISRSSALKDLAFNVSDFKARKEKTLSIDAGKILKTHKSLRTPQQIHFVILALTETVEAFSEFPIAMQESLVLHGWYEKYLPKQVIIRQGHAAQNFYFIISGTTLVSVAKKSSDSGESYGETVAFLKKGNSFGELALMYGGKRNASVVCLNNVELLSVTREDFIEIFMNLSTDTEPEHIRFLRNLPILEGWPIDKLPYDDPQKCLFTFFRRGTVLCRDSNNLEWIYIICSGACKVIKGLQEPHGKRYQLRYNPMKIEGRIKSSKATQNKSSTVYIQLNVLNSKDIFGLESVAFELLGESSSVTLVSDGAECVAINKSFFCETMSESYLRKLRFEIQPFPDEDSLKDKLQNYSDWISFQKEYADNFLEAWK